MSRCALRGPVDAAHFTGGQPVRRAGPAFMVNLLMFRLFAFLLVSVFVTCTPVRASTQPLLSPTELAARLADPQLRVIDIRAGTQEGKPAYDVRHIPGALSAPYAKWRGPKDNPGRLPDAAKLSALIQSLGIDSGTPVVVVYEGVDATEFGSAARVVWTLKAAGLANVSILNGGMKSWRAAGQPVTQEVGTVPPSRYAVKLDTQLIATQDEVAQVLARQSARLLDARPAPYFRGETRHAAARTPGTLVGAKNVAHDVWFVGDSATMQSADEVRRIAAREGIETDVPTVSFCNTGHWAATNWFVLSEVLGQKEVKLYPESMVGWSQAELPMTNVPGRLAQFWLQIREAVGAL
jgi:thiosulfate/3-mercaptopyruvate sulfurtransferase